MRFGSVCSGIEAASMAWEPLGWKPAWFAEIEPFPSAVLAHHWPTVPNLGDMTQIHHGIDDGTIEAPDVLVGGTPCQAFSIAGLRSSLEDSRGQLTLHFVGLADAIDNARTTHGLPPSIVVWENVPGVLTTSDNAFGCFLGALAGEDVAILPPGGKWTNAGVVVGPARTIAWRVLDAQYFGVAQRRRRVFVVASARDGFCPDEVLFEFDGMRRDYPPRREAGEGSSANASRRSGERSHWDGGPHPSLNQSAKSSGGVGCSNQEIFSQRGAYLAPHPVAFGVSESPDLAHCLRSGASKADKHESTTYVQQSMQVRRLTPTECERLQGFPDGHTKIPWRGKPADECPDGPRYKALGNSMCVAVMYWIGARIHHQTEAQP